MNHHDWTAAVGLISMGVTVACTVVAFSIAVWAIRRAFRDQREAEQNRSQG